MIRFRNSLAASPLLHQKWIGWRDRRGALLPADSADSLAGSPNRFALFECMIDSKTGTYLSEDFAFCKRWTDIGGEIWADLESRLDHVGPSVFNGDISAQFAAPVLATDAA